MQETVRNRRMEKMYNEKLHNLYCAPDIIKTIELRRVRWVEHVACMKYMKIISVIKLRRMRWAKHIACMGR
jgi:ribonuclease I